jgi:hypothetical protein
MYTLRMHIALGGEGGIRTLGRLTPTPDFESGTFDHSATSPDTTPQHAPDNARCREGAHFTSNI